MFVQYFFSYTHLSDDSYDIMNGIMNIWNDNIKGSIMRLHLIANVLTKMYCNLQHCHPNFSG